MEEEEQQQQQQQQRLGLMASLRPTATANASQSPSGTLSPLDPHVGLTQPGTRPLDHHPEHGERPADAEASAAAAAVIRRFLVWLLAAVLNAGLQGLEA